MPFERQRTVIEAVLTDSGLQVASYKTSEHSVLRWGPQSVGAVVTTVRWVVDATDSRLIDHLVEILVDSDLADELATGHLMKPGPRPEGARDGLTDIAAELHEAFEDAVYTWHRRGAA